MFSHYLWVHWGNLCVHMLLMSKFTSKPLTDGFHSSVKNVNCCQATLVYYLQSAISPSSANFAGEKL